MQGQPIPWLYKWLDGNDRNNMVDNGWIVCCTVNLSGNNRNDLEKVLPCRDPCGVHSYVKPDKSLLRLCGLHLLRWVTRWLGRRVTPEAEFLDVIRTCCSQLPLQTDFTPLPPLSKSDLKLVCNVNMVYWNFKSENLNETVRSGIWSKFYKGLAAYLSVSNLRYVCQKWTSGKRLTSKAYKWKMA